MSQNKMCPALRPEVVFFRDPESALRLLASTHICHPEKIRRLTAFEHSLLSACDGLKTLAELAQTQGCALETVLETLARWETLLPEIFLAPSTRPAEDPKYQPLKNALAAFVATVQLPAETGPYHQWGIHDAQAQFAEKETTVSHAFRDPHPALGGLSYGARLADTLLQMNAVAQGARILEIGGGTGLLASNILARWKCGAETIYSSVEYALLEIAPALRAAQQTNCAPHPRVTHLEGNFLDHDFKDQNYDLIIANEMIADLFVDTASREAQRKRTPKTLADRQVLKYGLEYHPGLPQMPINSGAIELLERLPNLLAPGGTAIFTEYGVLEGTPVPLALLGHVEFSIQFGHLLRVAENCGLRGEGVSLGDWLQFDPDFRCLPWHTVSAIRLHLAPFLGLEKIPADAFLTLDDLRRTLGSQFDSFGNLAEYPLNHPAHGFSPFRNFRALILKSPFSPHATPRTT